jgi:hypothetical protein
MLLAFYLIFLDDQAQLSRHELDYVRTFEQWPTSFAFRI